MVTYMRIGRSTFYNVYNYGAVLQALALQQFLCSSSVHDVELINYQIDEFKKLYSLNPLYGGPGMCLQRLLRLDKRYRQAKAFNNFIEQKLIQSKELDCKDVREYLNGFDVLVFGSDQIWNNNITGDDQFYYGALVPNSIKMISYAASFGTDLCNEAQKKLIQKYLRRFSKLSVREASGSMFIAEEIGKESTIVVDPVFLLSGEYWNGLQHKLNLQKNYILYYSLQNNDELIQKTNRLAQDNNLPIISIHPTAQKQRIKAKQLYDVNPGDFVYLIKNASFVCTNSFHAVAFSTIFRKKTIHVSHTKSRGRVDNLLDILGISEAQRHSIIDFSNARYDNLENMIMDSKQFLLSALEEKQ